MTSRRRLLPLVVLIGVLATTATALAGTLSWGSAIEVPGIAALGDTAGVSSVSCVSVGDCVAGGNYFDGSGVHAFVVSEHGGAWGSASEVAVPSALNVYGNAGLRSVSCAGSDCAAGGWAAESWGNQAIVLDEANGTWGNATQVPGLEGNFDAGHDSAVTSVSCGSPGNCAAVGYYAGGVDKYGFPDEYGGFVVSEKNGQWGTPWATLGYVNSVSCGGAGDCVAGGVSWDGKAFLVVERNGNWGGGRKVPGMAALSAGGESWVDSVSCASPGNCAAGGWYSASPYSARRHDHAFVVDERNGKWGRARPVGGYVEESWVAEGLHLSCAGAGNCVAGGVYTDHAHITQAFVLAERNGKWGNGIGVPGTATLNAGGLAAVESVSCASAGNCAVTGFYTDRASKYQPFVLAEVNGKWGTAVEVPGTAALGGGGFAPSVSCTGTGNCAIGGSYTDGSGHDQPFVTTP
jgi:hypothetical protein